MKNFFALLAMIGLLTLGANAAYAQQDSTGTGETVETTTDDKVADDKVDGALAEDEMPTHQRIKKVFIEGGADFMSLVLVALILGLAFCIERIIYLSLATTNTKKLLANIENALDEGGVEAAKEVCRNTRGPIASIFYQGLDRSDEGIEMVEKTVVAYGGVQMGLLEKGLTWIALFIALAPMLGFMGTVIGMIGAFDSIQAMGEISPAAVAGGIKVALITTVSGLVVAIILQIFYNFIVSKVDSIVNNMEDSSISVVDLLVKYNAKNN